MAKTLRQPPELSDASPTRIVADEIFESDARELAVANAIWAQSGLNMTPGFSEANAGLVHQVDFANSSEEACRTINAWVSDRTGDRIREIVGPGCLNELTRLVLTNAIYFKADWREKFNPGRTENLPFHLDDGTTVGVPTMRQTEDFRVFEDARFQVINLLYEGGRMSMQIFVPRRMDQLPRLEKSILAESPATWQDKMKWRRVDFELPRFRFETSLKVGRILAAMGMDNAFDSKTADFSGIAPDAFWLSDVLHKTYVDVNEEGTEAAGVTAAMLTMGVGEDCEPAFVKVDRPFVFTICGHSPFGLDGVLLFAGRVVDPRQSV